MTRDDETQRVPLVDLAMSAEARRLSDDPGRREAQLEERLRWLDNELHRVYEAIYDTQTIVRTLMTQREGDHARFQRHNMRITQLETANAELKRRAAELEHMFGELDSFTRELDAFTHRLAADVGDHQ